MVDRWAERASYSPRRLVAYWEWVVARTLNGPPKEAIPVFGSSSRRSRKSTAVPYGAVIAGLAWFIPDYGCRNSIRASNQKRLNHRSVTNGDKRREDSLPQPT